MRYALFLFALLMGWQVVAKGRPTSIKSWKTFKSDVGYEFKYPSCWKVQINDPDESGPMNTIRDINVSETSTCARPRFSVSAPNGLSFSGGWGPKKTKQAALKDITVSQNTSQNSILRGWMEIPGTKTASKMPEVGDELVLKKIKLGNDDAIGWVRVELDGLQWHFTAYCPDWWISVSGPYIDYKNMSPSRFKKLRKGDLGLPEPEKTIINSIRCIPAKQKEHNGGFPA